MNIDLDETRKGKKNPTAWTFATDTTISPDKDTEYPIELVSPVFHFRHGELFHETNDSCGTHVHVSPSNEYTSAQIKAVARAAIYFEPAINALVPSHRLGNEFCKTFFASNEHFKDKTVEQAIAMVDGVGETHKAIIELMNPPGRLSEPNRFYAWNFANLVDNGILTIEFRQAEGVTTPDGALAWAEFVVTFIGAAVTEATSYNNLKKYTPNVHGLKAFLGHGLVSDGKNKSLLGVIMGRAKDSASVSGSQPGKLSKEREDRLAKKRKGDDRKQIFVKKVIEDEKMRKKSVEEAGKLSKKEEM
ncbi:hypothetical protein BDM02DRAFT_3190303 [Thelephora ganbajun]|uniref:Uncharacterized protein n=1 Tax=Thelephora ganbajun TaxID=370292 RepID=A0ACB6Z5B1_THEGA|nr:hypothetical protein BDM02DRAFT_3190303 [Thelephora ganbajun]